MDFLIHRLRVAVTSNAVAASLAVLLSACGPANDTPRAAARDSAGVTLIDLGDGDDINAVTIGPAKASRIEIDGEQVLHGIQSGTFVDDGAIVASRGTNNVHVVNSSGETARTLGREGNGPGEFQRLGEAIVRPDGRVVAYDRIARRFAVYDLNGTLAGDHRVAVPEGASAFGSLSGLAGAFPDGGLLLWVGISPRAEFAPVPNTFGQSPVILYSLNASGKPSTVYGEFPGEETYITAVTVAPGRIEPGLVGPAPYGFATRFGVQGDRALVFDNRNGSVRAFDRTGRLAAIYRATWPKRAIKDSDAKNLLDEWVKDARPAGWEARRAMLSQVKPPEVFPAFREAFTASDGTFWLEPFHYWNGETRVYVGFDRAGAAVGKLAIPYGDRLLDMKGGRALLLRRSEEGLEQVEVVEIGSAARR